VSLRIERQTKVLQRSSLQLVAKVGRQPTISRRASTLAALSEDSCFDA